MASGRALHILFLTDNFPPEVNAPASRTFEHCREWVRAGHRVTVITGFPNFPTGKVFAGYRNRPWQSELVEGIRVVRVWTFIAPNAGLAKRIADYLSFMVMAVLAAPFVRRIDIVVGTSPQLFTACAAFLIGRFKRVPFVFELRDLWPESIRAVGAIRSERVLGMLERLELFLYRKAALIVAVTHSFKRDLALRGIDPDKIEVVNNGVDLARFSPAPRDDELAGRLGLSQRFVAGYVGTHGMAHGLDTLLGAAERLKADPETQDVTIMLLGEGAEKGRLLESARSRGLDNVVFLDSVSKQEVVRHWRLLDVALIHLKSTPLFETVIPSKLFEAMALGLPLAYGIRGESAEIVEREGVGLCFAPEDAEGLYNVLKRLRSDPSLREGMARNAVAAARKYDRTHLARRMLKLFEQRCERRA
jgi:glycosyltransferase involved in cell wall biosynthesis